MLPGSHAPCLWPRSQGSQDAPARLLPQQEWHHHSLRLRRLPSLPPPPNQLQNHPPSSELLIITDASLVEPFLRQPKFPLIEKPVSELPSPFGPSSRGAPIRAAVQYETEEKRGRGKKEELLPGTKVAVLFDEESGFSGWHEGELMALVDIPSATSALSSLLSSHSSIDSGGWQLGWHLVSVDKTPTSHSASPSTFRPAPTSSKPEAPTLRGAKTNGGPLSGSLFQTSECCNKDAVSMEQGWDCGVTLQTQDAAPKSWGLDNGVHFETNVFGAAQSRVRVAVLRVKVAPNRKGPFLQQQSVGVPEASESTYKGLSNNLREKPLVPSLPANSSHLPEHRRSNPSSKDPNRSEAPFSTSSSPNTAPPPSGLVSAGPLRRGDFLAAVGSPFGALSPGHFANSVSVGVVSNWWHAGENRAPILLADMRCLPGMEGGPVVDKSGGVVGVLWRPLRQRKSGAEVQLVITSDALAPALQPFGIDLLLEVSPGRHVSSSSHPGEAAAVRHPHFASITPATSHAIGRASRGLLESTDALPLSFVNGKLNRRESTNRNSYHRISDDDSAATSFSPLEIHPTSTAPRFHSPSLPSKKNPDEPSKPESFHTRVAVHTPDITTAAVTNPPHTLPGMDLSEGIHTWEGLPGAAETAAASIVLLSVNDGAWASGVVLSESGLILTNAHLIEPWRFATKPKVQSTKLQPRVRSAEGTRGWREVSVSKAEERCRLTGEGSEGPEGGVTKWDARAAATGGFRERGDELGSRGFAEKPAKLRNGKGLAKRTQKVGLELAGELSAVAAGERGKGTGRFRGFKSQRPLDSNPALAGTWERSEGAETLDGPASAYGALKRVGRAEGPTESTSHSGARQAHAEVRTRRNAYWDWILGGGPKPGSATRREQSKQPGDPGSRTGPVVTRTDSRPAPYASSISSTELLGPDRKVRPSTTPTERSPFAKRVPQTSFPRQHSTPPLSLESTSANPPRNYRPVRVRLSDRGAATWQSARVVFVSQGPFDAAVLQLLNAPTGLQAIVPADRAPSPGAKAIVVGHGLFGPMTELRPSVYSGVVSRVVKSPTGRAVMLQTTAAVHPGGSGGTVVNARGRLIGLVTSAARHSGGSMLPHLNFSIPVEALKPVFDFAKSGGLNVGLLDPLNDADGNLSAIWALAPPPPLPRPPSDLLPGHILEKLPGQEHQSSAPAKGTKFAQFLSDRGKELVKKTLLQSKL